MHVVGTSPNIATFSGGDMMYITLAEGINNRGYIGSYAGNAEDVDFGTYGGNASGKLHLTIMDVPKLTVATSGNIGIGTTTPLSLLHTTNGSVLFDGTTGATPVAGAGARMMWIPTKKAFRAGEIFGTQWDDALIGNWTFAGGLNNTAMGIGTTVFGFNNIAYGDYSFNAGTSAITDGISSAAFGVGNRSKYWSGMVVGHWNDSTAGSQNCCSDPLNRLFQIGNGANNFTRSNAMTVLENGKVGIGTTTPAQLLDVNGGIEVGNTTIASAGAIRFTGSKFEGNNGTNWNSFDQLPAGTLVSSPVYPNATLVSMGFTFQGVMRNVFMQQSTTGVAADTWLPTTNEITVNPEARTSHTAVWTGTEMIIWGGQSGNSSFNTGVKYNPLTNLWTPISLVNAPEGRHSHSAIWTGTEMIIWGGMNYNGEPLAGGRYNPLTDTWTTLPTAGGPSQGRFGFSCVWTGTDMIIWGGQQMVGLSAVKLNTGYKYTPASNTWQGITTTNAPSARGNQRAVWTGSEMIIWGGTDDLASPLNPVTGGKYNPLTNTWVSTSTISAPVGRGNFCVVWTGTEMIIWGGLTIQGSYLNDGARYNPTTNTWTALTAVNAPQKRFAASSIWTGTDMIIWGGSFSGLNLNEGAKYNPTANTWTLITNSNSPSERYGATGIWTGTQMIVFGGQVNNTMNLSTGGRYFPAAQPLSSFY
ncbi:MAG: hypothetical protein IPP93_01700 [Chitinophagaceae bacterium]|nr:hypothetical protein [Chitinophagaceae bacterium]